MRYASNAVLAKARAMYAGHITPSEYETLISCHTVNELLSQLQRRKRYASSLSRATAQVTPMQAEELLELLKRENLTGELVPHQRPVGGGSAPGKWLDGWAVALHLEEGLTPEKAAACLRQGEPPVVARIHQGKLLLDVAALLPGETILLAKACGKALKGDKEG